MDKDLQYYLDHPDELPDDPAVLAQLALDMGTPVVSEDPPEATKDVKKEEAAPSAEPAKEPVVEGKKQEKEEGDILMPSGKGTIPYAVLKSEREARRAAEHAVAELSQKMEDIQAQLAKCTSNGDAKAAEIGTEALATMTPEELDVLRTDFPTFGRAIDALMGTIGSLTKEVETLKQTEQVRSEDSNRKTASTVQELIDGEPVLVHLQATDPDLFARAVEIDKTLMGNPKYPDMASRFAKVAEIMDSTFGPFEGVAAKTVAGPKPSIDKEAARKAVIEKIEATKATPKSLSDLPAGGPPASDEQSALENLSAIELTDRMMKMSPDQRTAFLNRF